ALCGLVSLVLCLFVLFVLYYFDRSIWSAVQLADETGIPVLGPMNKVNGALDLLSLDQQAFLSTDADLLKNQIRSLRFEIDEEIHGPKIVTVTSLRSAADKTSLVYGLAWAYARIKQRVLIIDGNFNYRNITDKNSFSFLEDYFQKEDFEIEPGKQSLIQILGT